MSSKHKINYGADEIELEDCPFCGSDKLRIIIQDSNWVDDYPYLYYVECRVCLSRGAKKVDERYACAAWNQRATPEQEDGWLC